MNEIPQDEQSGAAIAPLSPAAQELLKVCVAAIPKPSSTLIEALIEVQKELKPAIKDATNPHFDSTFATLKSCWEACQEPLARNGFALTNYTELIGDQIWVITRLIHTSGEALETRLPALNEKRNMQGLGSAISYARRYGMMALIGICPEDDDGNAASGKGEKGDREQGKDQGNRRAAQKQQESSGSAKGSAKKKEDSTPERYKGQHADMRHFWKLWKQNGYNEEQWRKHLETSKTKSTKDLTKEQMHSLINDLRKALGEDV